MTILTIASNKGGNGKTITAVSIAAALATLDPTLLIDLDSQGHCASSFGFDPSPGVFEWLVNGNFMNSVIVPRTDADPGGSALGVDCQTLYLLPGDSRTKTVDLIYRAEVDGSARLVNSLRNIGHSYDWTVIDTAAAGLLQEAALAASDHVIIPFRPDTRSVDGVHATLALVKRLNPDVQATIMPVAYDRRLREHRQNVDDVQNFFQGSPVAIAAPVPARIAEAEAFSLGRTIWEHKDPALGEIRVAYAQLVDLIRAAAKRKEP